MVCATKYEVLSAKVLMGFVIGAIFDTVLW